ncbi:MAG: VOC family protein [Nitrososphaeraceae archaeon]|jgi:catechol 2,3-dioxygenase-like lactoylglutathione lyase family enzyme
MFRKIGMVILLVSDLDKLVTFYKDLLGMKVKHRSEDWVELSTKEGSTKLALHLTEKRTEDRIRTQQVVVATKNRTMLLGFNVSDLENVCRDLESKGIKFHKRLKEESFGKHAIIEDPEGNLISMAEIEAEDAYKQISYYHGFAPE